MSTPATLPSLEHPVCFDRRHCDPRAVEAAFPQQRELAQSESDRRNHLLARLSKSYFKGRKLLQDELNATPAGQAQRYGSSEMKRHTESLLDAGRVEYRPHLGYRRLW